MTADTDPLNPSMYVDGGGTEGYWAPEQFSSVSVPDMKPIDRFKMLAHTNVWGVGMIIYAMAALDPDPLQPAWLGTGENDGNQTDVANMKNYSDHLTDLVQECIQFHPDKRPSWTEVLERIDQAMNEGTLNLANDLKAAEAIDVQDEDYLHFVPEDEYAIRLAFDDLPGMEKSI